MWYIIRKDREGVGGGWSIMGSRLSRYHLSDCIFDGVFFFSFFLFFASQSRAAPSAAHLCKQSTDRGDKAADENGSAAGFLSAAP